MSNQYNARGPNRGGNRGGGRGTSRGSAPAASSSNLTATAAPFVPSGNPQSQAQTLSQSMGNLSLSSKSFLLANYFEIKVGKSSDLYRYELGIRKVTKDDGTVTGDSNKKVQVKGKGREGPAPNPSDDSTSTDPGIGRAKKRRIVWLAMERLERLNNGKPLATDYGTEIISTDKIRGDNNSQAILVEYFDEYQTRPGPECQTFEVTLSGPAILSLTKLVEFLSNNSPTVNPANYQRKEETVKALNTIFSYKPYRKCFPTLTSQAAVQGATLTTANGHKFYGITRSSGANMTTDTGGPLNPKPSPGLDAIPGFARSVRAVISGQGRLFLNINTTTAIFYQQGKPNTLQALIELWRKGNYRDPPPWSAVMLHNLVDFLMGIRVRTTYCGANDNFIGRVTNVATTISPNQEPIPANCRMTFPDLQSNQTVADFFRAQYPGTQVTRGSKDIVVVLGEGAFRKTIPASCLEVIPGQVNRNVAEKPAAGIRTPLVNKGLIDPTGRKVFFSSDGTRPNASDFGLDLAAQLVRVPIIKLQQPILRYRQHRIAQASQSTTILPEKRGDSHELGWKYGSWNLRNRSFVKPAGGFKWTFVYLGGSDSKPWDRNMKQSFGNSLQTHLQTVGMTGMELSIPPDNTRFLSEKYLPGSHDKAGIDRQYAEVKKLLTDLKGRGIRLVVLLLTAKNVELYAAIKRAGDQDVGISTICHVLRFNHKTRQLVPQDTQDFFGNLTMKVNLKLDISAVNQALDPQGKGPILTKNTMILGIDVTHPGTTAMKGAPSVAAVVGSVDEEFAQWPASLHVNDVSKQGKKESNERVVHLDQMVYERVQDYYNRNRKVPDKIIVYRDGLSEGQFEMCKAMEFPAIQAGLNRLLQQHQVKGATMPPILLICAVKRHNTRLFPQGDAEDDNIFVGYGGNPNRKSPYNYNPLPGTLVNSDITYGEGKDFFLISQKAIQGTARPTHYVILENQMPSFTRDQIAQMTHNLCYLFGRATRSVGVCPAAYYADLAADRARCYVRNVYNPVNRSMAYEAGQVSFNLQVHDDLKKTMFYI